MLHAIWMTAVLATSSLAPVAALEKAALQKEFEQLWVDLNKPEPEGSRAAIKLYALGKEVVPLLLSG